MATSSVGTPMFQATGLSSGLDTTSIINSLVTLESQPITDAKNKQAAYKTQISQIGQLSTLIGALNDAAQGLKTNGVLGVTQVGATSGFTATPSATALAGQYSVQVDSLATPAKARSAAFNPTDTVIGSDLTISVNGTAFSMTVPDGQSLEGTAAQINASGAPVSATILNTNGTRYLSLSNRDTGFTVGQPAASALTVTESVTGTTGKAMAIAITQPATNAKATIDGLQFERTNNVFSDALPGVTIGLTSMTSAPESLVLSNSTTSTQANLQKFVDAYNSLMNMVHGELNPQVGSDRSQSLAGDSSLKNLQASMQRMVSGVLNANGAVRTLADIGITTMDGGTLTIDATKLGTALSTGATAVNSLFQTTTTGIGDVSAALNKSFTDIVSGVFVTRTSGLNSSIKQLDTTISQQQARVDSYRKALQAQFVAMESIVSNFKSLGNYLTQQEAVATAAKQ